MARRSKVSSRMCTQVALFSNSSAPLSRPSRRPKCTEPPSRLHGGARRLGGSEHRAHTTMPSRAAPPRVRPRPRTCPGALSHQLSPAAYPTPLTASPHTGPPPSRPPRDTFDFPPRDGASPISSLELSAGAKRTSGGRGQCGGLAATESWGALCVD